MNKNLKPNEKLALIESIQLWKWLAKNPTKVKINYPFKDVTEWENHCPLCHLAQSHCSRCLMAGTWHSADILNGRPCDRIFYLWAKNIWDYSINYDRQFFAAVIVEDLTNVAKGETKK